MLSMQHVLKDLKFAQGWGGFFFGRGPGVDKNKMAFGKLGTRFVHFISVLFTRAEFFSAGKISSLANHVLVFFYLNCYYTV